MAFDFRRFLGGDENEEYVEIDVSPQKTRENKVSIKPFVLRNFDDVNDVLNALREGYTITIIDIKQLKSKDIIELKRAVAKIKKTIDAIEGSIAGFGDNILIATPKFAEIHRTSAAPREKEKKDFIGEAH